MRLRAEKLKTGDIVSWDEPYCNCVYRFVRNDDVSYTMTNIRQCGLRACSEAPGHVLKGQYPGHYYRLLPLDTAMERVEEE